MRVIFSWDGLRDRGERRSKSQIRRSWNQGLFPRPDGYNGKCPFWTDQTWDRHIEDLMARQAAKGGADDRAA